MHIENPLTVLTVLKHKPEGQRDSAWIKVLVLQVSCLIPGTTYGPLSTSGGNP